MKKIFVGIALFMLTVLLVACGDTSVKHTVTFDSVGGSSVASKSVVHDELVDRPTDPTKDGFDFVAWYKDRAYSDEWKFATDKVTEDITLYAKWDEVDGNTDPDPDPVVVTVTFNFNYSGASAPVEVEVVKGEKIKTTDVPADPTRTDYLFLGWSTSRTELVAFNLDSAINENTTLYAAWEYTLEEVTITFKVEDEDDVSVTITKGDKINPLDVPTPEKANHTFGGWFDAENKEWNFTTEEINADLVVTAKFILLEREGNPITTPEDLALLMTGSFTDSDEIYYLTKDIDMDGVLIEYNNDAKFTGTLDGQGFTIKNLTYHSDAVNAKMGLFKTINDAVIMNLNIDNADIKSENERAGILAAEVDGGENSVINVHITNSKVYGNQGNNSAGGLFAYVKVPLDLDNISLVNVDIEGATQGVGGLIGRSNVSEPFNFTNIFFQGSIKGKNRVGGIFGDSASINQTVMENIVVLADITVETTHASALLGKGDAKSNATEEFDGIVVKNFVGIVTINGGTGNIGYISGDNNKIDTTNVYIYYEGTPVTHSSAGTNDVLTNIHSLFDETFWEDNLTSLTENDLWMATDSGIYVLVDSEPQVLAPDHVVITFDLNYDEKDPLTYSVKPGSKAPLFTPNRDDYDFDGWFLDDVLFDNADITEAITLVAKWSQTIYTDVTYKVEGEDDVVLLDVAVGSLLTKPQNPTKFEHDFIGWFDGNDHEWNFATDLVVEDLVLTAKFEPIQFGDVTFKVDGEVEDVVHMVIGTKIVKPQDPVKDGYLFLGWYDEEDNLWDFDDLLDEDELTLAAKFYDESLLDELNHEHYVGIPDADDFFTVTTSKITDMPAYDLDGTLIDETIKFDGSGSIKFETPQPFMKLELIVRTRKDESGGRIKINNDVYNLLEDNFTIINVTLLEATEYTILRDNKEIGVYYIRVYYSKEEPVEPIEPEEPFFEELVPEGDANDFFTIGGDTTLKSGAPSYTTPSGIEILKPFKFDSKANISFTATKDDLILEVHAAIDGDATARLDVNGTFYDLNTDGTVKIITIDLVKDETYTLKYKTKGSVVYYISVYNEVEEPVEPVDPEEELLYELYYSGSNLSNTDGFFTEVPGSKVTDGYLGKYVLNDDVEISTGMKMDSSAKIEFTATEDDMILEVVISTRKAGKGKIYIDDILTFDGNPTDYEVLDGEFTILTINLTKGVTYRLIRRSTEQVIMYVKVYTE